MLDVLIAAKNLTFVKSNLKIDWATHKAAKYACENWHYSGCMPVGKLVKVGVWENELYIGCVIFGRGANAGLLQPYQLKQSQGCELTRIALTSHVAPVSKIMMIAVKFLLSKNPLLRLIVSFADASKGHHGGIYQATNWIYNGMSESAEEYLYKGKKWHGRAFRKSYGSHLGFLDKGLKIVAGAKKHRYLMPLDKEIKEQIKPLSKPYPKRVTKAISGDQLESGGAVPTYTLQTIKVA